MSREARKTKFKIMGGPWVACPIRLIADKRLSSTARLVFQILMANANNETGACFPGFERIAVYVGLDNARSLYRPMKELEDAGYIVRHTHRHDERGYRTSDEYELYPDNDAAPTIDDLNDEAERRRKALSLKRAQGQPSEPLDDGLARDPMNSRRAESRAHSDEVDLDEVDLENARADSNDGTEPEQPTEPSSASERIPDQSRAKPEETDQRARAPESDQLFGSADSSADAADCPPQVAPAPPKGKRPPAGKGDPDFERFWSMAPKYATHHAERKEAWDAWLRARKEASVRGILTAWEAYTAEWATWDEEDWEFIPSEKTWLKGCRWRLPVKPRKSKLKSVRGARPSQVDENLDAVRRARAAFNARQAGRSSLEDVLPVREASGRPA